MHQTEICWLFFLRSYRAADDYLHYKKLCFFLSQASSPLLVIRIVLSKHPKGQMLVMVCLALTLAN